MQPYVSCYRKMKAVTYHFGSDPSRTTSFSARVSIGKQYFAKFDLGWQVAYYNTSTLFSLLDRFVSLQDFIQLGSLLTVIVVERFGQLIQLVHRLALKVRSVFVAKLLLRDLISPLPIR